VSDTTEVPENSIEVMDRLVGRLMDIRETLAGEHPALDAKIAFYAALDDRASEMIDALPEGSLVAPSVVEDNITGWREAIAMARAEGWIL
jgi:hypothetical protein